MPGAAAAPSLPMTTAAARPASPFVLAVCGIKGGSAKTTTAVSLAALLGRSQRVLLVDADPQGYAVEWAEAAALPCAVVAAGDGDLTAGVAAVKHDYDVVIIDTPANAPGVTTAAMMAAGGVLVPTQPTMLDAGAAAIMLELAGSARAAGADCWLRFLLVRVLRQARSRVEMRAALTDEWGVSVLEAEVPQREWMAYAANSPVPARSPYVAVAAELAPLLPAVEAGS